MPDIIEPQSQGIALLKIIAVWEKVSNLGPHISISKMIHKENSSDFAMGRRPELKSEEFALWFILVIEIFKILCLKPLKKCYTVWEHDPARRYTFYRKMRSRRVSSDKVEIV